jgi:pilus assembly protein CpaF
LTVRTTETRLEENAFATELGLLAAIDRLLRASGRALDPDATSLDTKLRDGTRLTACFPPLSGRGTTLVLKKNQRGAFQLADLVAQGFLSEAAAGFLEAAVRDRRTLLVAGGFGAGQSMLIGALAQLLPPEDRVAVIEEASELFIYHAQVMNFEVGPGFSLSQVLRLGATRLVVPNALALNPLEVVTTLHSGLDGALLGSLGNSIEDAIDRLDGAAYLALPGIKPGFFRELLGRSAPVIALVNRFSDGSRRIVQLAEIGEGLALREIDLGEAGMAS